jgi:spore germination protein YaaH
LGFRYWALGCEVKTRIFVLILALVSCVQAAERPALTTVMYLVNRPAAIASFEQHWQDVSIIAPQSFTMDAQGFISGEVPPAVMDIAREHKIAVMPLVTNQGFDQPLMHTVLDTQEARARAIRYLLYYALRDGYIGFQFDYENIKYFYRNRFSLFFHEAAVEFHKHGLLLTAAVVGKDSDDRKAEAPGGYDDWSGVYDYPKLARDADFLSIMAYPQHAGFSGPGPIAGLPWVKKIVDFTRSVMPARKISLGVPLYGFHWIALAPGEKPDAGFVQDNAGTAVKKWKGHSTVYAASAEVIAKYPPEWNDTERAYRATFTDAEGRHEVWYEDARSLAPKIELAAAEKLHGISAWALGQEDPALWELLTRDYRILHPKAPLAKGSFEERTKKAAGKLGGR